MTIENGCFFYDEVTEGVHPPIALHPDTIIVPVFSPRYDSKYRGDNPDFIALNAAFDALPNKLADNTPFMAVVIGVRAALKAYKQSTGR